LPGAWPGLFRVPCFFLAVEGAGHAVMLERPGLVNDALARHTTAPGHDAA
jgi:pimeloyl-ACP methyl ester carboxylesterase